MKLKENTFFFFLKHLNEMFNTLHGYKWLWQLLLLILLKYCLMVKVDRKIILYRAVYCLWLHVQVQNRSKCRVFAHLLLLYVIACILLSWAVMIDISPKIKVLLQFCCVHVTLWKLNDNIRKQLEHKCPMLPTFESHIKFILTKKS